MRSPIVIVFFLFALMLGGVLMSSSCYLRDEYSKSQETKLWISSISLAIIGLILFAIGTATTTEAMKSNSIVFTFANIFYVGSIAAQFLFCVSLRKSVSKKSIYLFILGIVIFGIHFEYLRGSGNFVGRVLEVASIICILLVMQLYQLQKVLRMQSSLQLKFLFIFTILELFTVILRLVVSALQVNPVLTIDSVPMSLMAVTWFNLSFNVLSYLTMLGFWSERSAAKQVEASIENERISVLLDERERLIGSLLAANKSAATGALSASLAHELNQPIGANRINLFTLRRILTNRGIHDDSIEEIISCIELDNQRSGDIVASLRSIFTQEGVTTSRISIAEALNSVVRLVQGECIRLGIALEIHIDDALISANRVELQQIFINIINNAIDALKTQEQSEQKTIWLRSMRHSDRVQVLISDNGPGISEQLAPRIFDLFETSKKAGMGIGLWLSRYCIQRIGGEISYVPRVGGGSEFLINIPPKRDIAQ